jgi:transcriptional regulator with XRE-family HTH domain
MLIPLLAGLTKENKAELAELGIPHSRLSEWKSGKRRPTAAQLMVLATITKTDPLPLLYWLAEEEANPAQRDLFQRVKERGSWVALTVILTVLLATPDPAFAQCSSSKTQSSLQLAGRYIVDILLRLLGRRPPRNRVRFSSLIGRASGLFFGTLAAC